VGLSKDNPLLRLRPKPCQFDKGTGIFTNKLALTYRIESAWHLPDDDPQLLPSVGYLNESLNNCSINYILIELLAEDRTAEQFGWNQWGPQLSVWIYQIVIRH